MTEKTQHVPVMFDEVLAALRAADGGTFLDCTLGGGGHTEGILEANPANHVVASDRDERAVARARERLNRFEGRVELHHLKFSAIEPAISPARFRGMLADLGISTDQLKENRGFSFRDPAPLDMRMDEAQEISADDVVNRFSERDLYVALRKGGVGPEAKIIAREIVRARPIERSDTLGELIAKALRGRHRDKQTHPATVVFQALRMAVNEEAAEIEALLDSAPRLVESGGRFAVITFHSIEDKVVTHRMRAWQQGGDFSALSPGGVRSKTLGKMVERKAITPRPEEIERNPSARSARLRVFEFA